MAGFKNPIGDPPYRLDMNTDHGTTNEKIVSKIEQLKKRERGMGAYMLNVASGFLGGIIQI